MKNTKFAKLLLPIVLFCFALQASAQQSTMMTVLHKPHRESAQVAPDDVSALLKGFAACNPPAALPRNILAPLGVKFLGRRAEGIQFSFSNLLRERDVLLLEGNDPASMEKTSDDRFLFYGGKYKLGKSIKLGNAIELIGVGEMLSVSEPRARVGVTYTFNRPAADVLAWIESHLHVDLKSRIDRLPKVEKATHEDTWFTLGDDGRTVTCWRVAD